MSIPGMRSPKYLQNLKGNIIRRTRTDVRPPSPPMSGRRKPPPRCLTHFEEIRKELAPKPNSRLTCTAISPTGDRVGLFTSNQFWIYDTSTDNNTRKTALLYTGSFGASKHGNTYVYTKKGSPKEQEHDLCKVQFRCAAMSDDFVAIALKSRILIFDRSGKCLFYFQLEHFVVFQLRFSHSLQHLLVVASNDFRQRLLIIPTSKFLQLIPRQPGTRIGRVRECFDVIEDCEKSDFDPKRVAFSSDDKQVVICTNCLGDGSCEIRLFKLGDDGNWQKWQVSLKIRLRNSQSGELTGIQLYVCSASSLH